MFVIFYLLYIELFYYLYVTDFSFGSIVDREHTLYDSTSLKFGVFLMAQYMVYLGICSVDTLKEYVF